jgi:hypothetical protein
MQSNCRIFPFTGFIITPCGIAVAPAGHANSIAGDCAATWRKESNGINAASPSMVQININRAFIFTPVGDQTLHNRLETGTRLLTQQQPSTFVFRWRPFFISHNRKSMHERFRLLPLA